MTVVVVTGGSAGVGRATARAFAARGDSVAVLGRGRDGLEASLRDIHRLGGRGHAVSVDVADDAAVEAAAGEIERALGPIDVWVNNAMVSVFAPVTDVTPGDFKRVTEVSYLGYVYGTMAALRRMRSRDAGVVVQVGSALAYRAIPLQSAYCGAKHAIEGFTESLRCELAHEASNVRVTMVQLPAVNTPQFHWVKTTLARHPQPVPPIFQPEVAADAIVWAAEHPRREYWVAWPTARAIVANRLVPGLLDRYLARTGVAAQQTERAIEPGRPDNLYEPLPGDQGAHGEFDDRSKPASVFWRLTRSRGRLRGTRARSRRLSRAGSRTARRRRGRGCAG
jgi:NAD(P)-dependent dehydrogenase (short-subunit alcohol dehydrogenase family)